MSRNSEEFDSLLAIKRSVMNWCQFHLPALGIFHLSGDFSDIQVRPSKTLQSRGFANLQPTAEEKLNKKSSITSSSTCIRSLLNHPWFAGGENIDFSKWIEELENRHADNQLKTGGLEHNNPFSIGLLTPVFKQLKLPLDSPLSKACVATLKQYAQNEGVSIGGYPPNGYLTYWALRGLEARGEIIDECAKNCLKWSHLEFYKQISLFTGGIDEQSDVYQLGYNLLIQYRFNKLTGGILRLGLDTLFKAQLDRGVWEKKDPIFVYGQFGDAYCFPFELLSSLLHDFQGNFKELLPYEENFKRVLNWVERNRIPIRSEVWEEYIPVWRSGNRPIDKEPESWATAEVYAFLQLYRNYLSSRMQDILQKSFKGLPKAKPDSKPLDNLFHPDVTLQIEGGNTISLKKLLKERLLDPLSIASSSATAFSLVRNSDPNRRVRSGILFGPPGTGKTTYVKSIASYLGWPLIILNPSDFAQEGLPLLPSVTAQLFEQLLELEDTVIFFDEMEELMHSRTGDNAGSFEQRFLTTTLLPKLQDLADRATCLFFVATNNYESIDEAAKRPGRFDFRIQILPPSFLEKERMLRREVIGQKLFEDHLELWLIEMRYKRNKEKVSSATRSEFLNLVADLKRNLGGAREILDNFKPSLLEPGIIDQLKKEASYNSFERRN